MKRSAWLGLVVVMTAAACGDEVTVTVERPAEPDVVPDEPQVDPTPEQVELEGYCVELCKRIDHCSTQQDCAATCSFSESACTSERALLVYCMQGQVNPASCSMPADCVIPLGGWLDCRGLTYEGSCAGEAADCACDIIDSRGSHYETSCSEGSCICRVDGEAIGVCEQSEDDQAVCAPFEDCCAGLTFGPGYPGDTP